MRPIGKIPFRELKSFGIAGLLGEDGRVFYNTIFNTRNLGRVTDLLAARLLKSGVDEFRLRQLLSLAAFEAYRVQIAEVIDRKKIAAEKAKAAALAAGKEYTPKEEDDKLDQPITLECGVDSEKIGVSIAMTIPDSVAIDPVALTARINARQPQGDFERLGVTVGEVADLFVVRWQSETRRLEFATLLNLGDPAAKQPVELVSVSVEESKSAPKPQEYTEAGDLDYEALLASDTRLQGKKGKGLTAALVKKAQEAAEGDTRVTAGSGEDDEDQLLGGDSGEGDVSQRVEGKEDGEDGSAVGVEGDAVGGPGANKRISGKKRTQAEDSTVFDADSEEVSIRKKKVKGKKTISEDEETEIESDSGKEGESQIKFKNSGATPDEDLEEESVVIQGGTSAVKKKGKLRRYKTAEGGVTEEEEQGDEDEEIVIEGAAEKREKKSKFTFKGAARELSEEEEEVVAYGRGGKRLRGQSAEEGDDGVEVVEEEVTPIKRARKLLRRIWPFGKKDSEAAEGEEGAEGQEQDEIVISGTTEKKQDDQTVVRFKADQESQKSTDREYRFKESDKEKKEEQAAQAQAKDPTKAEGKSSESATDTSGSDQIMKTFEENVIGQTVDRVQREAMKLKDEIKDERTKRWVDNLTRDLIAEKSSLRETAKRISANVRQKEFEFKTKQTALEEEVRKRDEQLIQKSHALNRTREQLTQVSRSLDRMKQLSQEAADAAQFKQKYALAQKVLQTTKDENSLLQAKIEEMRVQVTQLQLGGSKKGPSQTEFNVMQSKYERAFKQIEELRRQNQRMVLEASNRRGVGGSSETEELKRKADTSSRMAAIAKKESELLQGRVAKMQRDDKNLRAEVLRLQEALRKASGKQSGNAA